jgi:cytochrome c biogenesis protein CcmG/thiol:disulfide interchange protein DsbE
MRKSSIIFAAAGLMAIFAIGIAIAATRIHRSAGPAHTDASAAKAAPNSASPPAVIKFASDPAPTPPFQVKALLGTPVSTSQFPGKVVLLSFWATWCPPCRLEIPELVDLQARYKDRLQVIGISMDDADTPQDIQHVKDVASELHINYPVVIADPELVETYGGVPALPTTFVLNTSARVVQKHTGLYSTEDFENEIRSLLGMPVNATVETFNDTGQIFLTNAARATELPGVDFTGLTPEQKREALKRMNSQNCTCGCGLTIAECRMNDSSCDVSQGIAEKIIKDVAETSPAKAVHH